ncbi:MAG TPA: CvpA family protein, partial [Solirubrobacterales bacterium]
MTILDWAIIAFTLALALWGYRQGLIVGALTLVGFGVGAFLGSRLGPVVLSQGADSPYAPLCGAIGALLVGALSAVALEGIALALRRRLINHPFMHRADGAGGAALIGAVALGLAWIFGAVALHAPGTTQLRADVQNSVILRELDHVLPPSGGVLNVLGRVDPAPSITGPATPRKPPNSKIAED